MTTHRSALMIVTAMSVAWVGREASTAAGLVTIEAESGALGSDFAVSSSGSPVYITILTDNTAYNPGSAARVASYTVHFPSAGIYQLYARLRVGSGGYDDDSMFYAAGFGGKSPTLDSDWVFVNGLAGVGYTAAGDVVDGAGHAGNQVWKWINLSQLTGESGFTVSAGSLTQTFQIGARENGLDLDRFAFGTVGTAFTVSNLDAGTLPVSNINTNLFIGPDGIAIHRFSAVSSGLNLDGANPAAGLAWVNGVLCGTALNGGARGAGTAFCLSTDGTNFSAFHTFTDTPEAGHPQGGLAVADNNFFGTSLAGGLNGVGAVFGGNTNGNMTILRSFAAVSPDNATNSGGASPNALLALSGHTLYGTSTAGGASANGTVFTLSTNGSAFVTLHDFTALDANTGTNADGALPCGGLMVSGKTLYGTTSVGGSGGAGVIFSLPTSGGGFTTLHHFAPLDPVTATNADGAFPSGGLVLSHGILYGTTLGGGRGGEGVVFSMSTNGLDFSVLHHFSPLDPVSRTNADGASPCASLMLSSNVLYGTASAGGAGGAGTVFALRLDGGQFHTLHSFAAPTDSGTNAYGAFPVAPLLRLGPALYGTAFSGGPGAAGTVFSLPIPAPPALIRSIQKNANGSGDGLGFAPQCSPPRT